MVIIVKILVPIKRVIDYNVTVRVKADHSDVDLSNTKMAINPLCEVAVEEAVRLKEKGIASEVVVVSIGDNTCHEQLREMLALGADRAIHIDHDKLLDSLQIAKLLQKLVEQEQPGLVLLGRQSIDSDNSQTGQMLSALCDLPQAAYASKIEVDSGKVLATQTIDGGTQQVLLDLPAVISVELTMNEPRFASLPNIMKARKTEIEIQQALDFGVDLNSNLEIIEVSPPEQRPQVAMVKDVAELLDKLNQAGVIE